MKLIRLSFVIAGDAKVVNERARFWMQNMGKVTTGKQDVNGIVVMKCERKDLKIGIKKFRQQQIKEMFNHDSPT